MSRSQFANQCPHIQNRWPSGLGENEIDFSACYIADSSTFSLAQPQSNMKKIIVLSIAFGIAAVAVALTAKAVSSGSDTANRASMAVPGDSPAPNS
jgi:hypothetical protein